MNNDQKSGGGFLLGFILGGAAVFLLGTKTGRNLLKVLSEQGLAGISEIIEESNLEDFEEELEEDIPTPIPDPIEPNAKNGENKVSQSTSLLVEEKPKRRFFRKVRR